MNRPTRAVTGGVGQVRAAAEGSGGKTGVVLLWSAASRGRFRWARRVAPPGAEHILTGYDHLLFLVGLLIVGGGFLEAARIITAFTVAHSITLGIAAFDLVTLPPRVVEPLIALTIVRRH